MILQTAPGVLALGDEILRRPAKIGHLRSLRVVFRLPPSRRSRNLCLFDAMMTPGL